MRRLVAMAAALATLAALAGAAGCARQAEPVAFNNEPAQRPDKPAENKPLPRPAQPPCEANDLESLWPENGHTFSDGAGQSEAIGLAVLVRNTGAATCSLSGHPKVQGTDSDGKPAGPPAEPGIYLRAVDPGHHPAIIQPGEPAKVLLSMTSEGCGGPEHDVRGAEVALDNGFSFSINNAWLRGTCQLRVSAWGEVEQRVRRFWALESRLLTPPTVKAGTELLYTVELINITAATVPMEPCPVFTHLLSLEENVEMAELDKLYHLTYKLNCSVRSIGPRGAVRYQMKMPIPEGFPEGKTYILWFLEEGQHPSAMAAFTVTR